MNALIQITTDQQGSSVVSARELHEFLEVKTKFVDWIKGRITRFEFRESEDYTVLTKPEGSNVFSEFSEKRGRPEIDYALTLDMAKELAMVEGNAKGKAARQYFIQAEKTLRQAALTAQTSGSSSTEQVLVRLMAQSNQLLADQQQRLAGHDQLLTRLRTEVDQIVARDQRPVNRPPDQRPAANRRTSRRTGSVATNGNRPPASQPMLPGLPAGSAAPTSPGELRKAIHHHVSDYSAYYGATIAQTYGYLYKRLFEVHGLSVHRLNRAPTESLLDVLERYGELSRLYALAVNELTYPHE